MFHQTAEHEEFYVARKQPRQTKKTRFSDHEPRIHLVGKNKNEKKASAVARRCRNIDPEYALDEFDSLEYETFEKRKR